MSDTGVDTIDTASAPIAIQLTDIVKRFPGVIANDGVNLTVRKGSVHAIVGENGAGSDQDRVDRGALPVHALPGGKRLIDSYHCSRYNQNTGRLTAAMFEAVFARAVEVRG